MSSIRRTDLSALNARGVGAQLIREDTRYTEENDPGLLNTPPTFGMGTLSSKIQALSDWFEKDSPDVEAICEDPSSPREEREDQEDQSIQGSQAGAILDRVHVTLAKDFNDAMSSVGGEDLCHTLDLTMIQNQHVRSTVQNSIKDLISWINRTSGTNFRSCTDRSGVMTVVQYTGGTSVASEYPPSTNVGPVEVSSPRTDGPPSPNEDSERYIEILKFFHTGFYFNSRSRGGKRSQILSTATPGFSDKEIKHTLDSMPEPSLPALIAKILKKSGKDKMFRMLYDLRKPILRKP